MHTMFIEVRWQFIQLHFYCEKLTMLQALYYLEKNMFEMPPNMIYVGYK